MHSNKQTSVERKLVVVTLIELIERTEKGEPQMK